ncbi:hypothetical protein GF382_01135 [Candidatus Falkowbacteria bacterium]|nr:hypothetical protein [Candidatus Falkowbacteria bacterium]
MGLAVKYLIAGILAKALASFDDVVTRIPIIAHFTRSRKGRIAFALGNLLAVSVAIVLAWLFSSLLNNLPNTHLITSILIMVLAISIYFDLFGKKRKEKIDSTVVKLNRKISRARFLKLIAIGFIASLVTLLDDFIVLTPLFLGSFWTSAFAIAGIYLATIVQLIVVIYLSKYLYRLKHVKKMAVFGLLILAILIFFKVI